MVNPLYATYIERAPSKVALSRVAQQWPTPLNRTGPLLFSPFAFCWSHSLSPFQWDVGFYSQILYSNRISFNETTIQKKPIFLYGLTWNSVNHTAMHSPEKKNKTQLWGTKNNMSSHNQPKITTNTSWNKMKQWLFLWMFRLSQTTRSIIQRLLQGRIQNQAKLLEVRVLSELQ